MLFLAPWCLKSEVKVNVCGVQGTILSALYLLTQSLQQPQSWYSYYPHLTGEQTEALRIYLTHQGHKTSQGQKPSLRYSCMAPRDLGHYVILSLLAYLGQRTRKCFSSRISFISGKAKGWWQASGWNSSSSILVPFRNWDQDNVSNNSCSVDQTWFPGHA